MCAALLCARSVRAQETPWRWGAWVSGSAATPTANVRELPGTLSCLAENSRLDDVTGFVIGVDGDIAWINPLMPALEVGARIGFAFSSTTFASRESIGKASDAGGALRDVVVEYQSTVRRSEIRIEPEVRWHARDPIVLSLGGLLAVPIATPFDQRESLVAPAQATYADGSSERALSAGTLNDYARPWIGIVASIGVDVAVANRVILRPQLGGVFALGSPMRDVDWHPHELRASIGVVFGELGESTPIAPYRDDE